MMRKKCFLFVVAMISIGLVIAQLPAKLGTNVSDMTFIDGEGEEVALSTYNGKFVFVDFWFTQCKGCIEEFPDAKRLKDELTGENILFVNISIDMKENDWKSSIEKYNLSGENIWTGGFGRFDEPAKVVELIDNLGFNSFPKYWILDPEGTIIDFDAPRPSHYMGKKRLITELKELISQP